MKKPKTVKDILFTINKYNRGIVEKTGGKYEDIKELQCHFCKKPISDKSLKISSSYWWGFVRYCHKDCEKIMNETEAIACQKIDADCNDCRYFVRGEYHKGGLPPYFSGTCLKFKRATNAYPVAYTGHNCFKHRKDEDK